MKITYLLSFLIAIGMLSSCTSKQEKTTTTTSAAISIIPKPVKLQKGEGSFVINNDTKILVDAGNEELKKIAQTLADQFQKAGNLPIKVEENTGNTDNNIVFTLKTPQDSLGKEGYTLSVTDKGVTLKANQATGVFYGYQTIRQLLPTAIESSSAVNGIAWSLPVVEITDTPRFVWRGLHLDVCRHFMPKEFVKKYIDLLAFHKLNTFHWHLTDDQGWRIEIKKYPKLTEIGGWRKETLIGHAGEKVERFDGKRYGGFYTQDEIKEVVQYAKERYITVVPEIEMPGHAMAAIAAYPELGVTGKPVEVGTKWGVFPDIFNAEDKTFSFLEDVLTEVITLFPSEYIHVGGDEAIKDYWKTSPLIKKKIKDLKLKDEHELQSYFIQRIEKFLNAKNKKLIGWDEILEGGIAPNATIMSWRGTEGGIAAAKAHHNAVMTPGEFVYFDHYQGPEKTEPLAIGGFLPLTKVYSYEPIPAELSVEESKYILGAQANLWTEYIKTPEHAEYMVFPRASALAEVVWSPKEQKNWDDFAKRIPQQLERYKYLNVNYAKTAFDGK
ncbi:beta-N-acetylhexosaminidase [Xanthocytophaga agilis]|uniref:beta-N-acetylhexosaminidase n=1 Tax=Xanthocytophaga agilis TaxID=3048010 RepID=A0AAE3QWV2_9BACT|nr:beta-N-acetylhexosaminidase [Xanthocytophaga agilis]MDJ1499025.1 beta-N-acetylhexosaminidase [Xanthocytophaga agilis]